jgi:putative membrane protein
VNQEQNEVRIMWYWHGGAWGWFWMLTMMLTFWLLVVAVAVVVVRGAAHDGERTDRSPSTRTPEQVLRDRFARGEIDADEYEHRRKVLTGVP